MESVKLPKHDNETKIVSDQAINSATQPTSVLGRFSDVAMLAADWFWEMDKELRFTYQSQRFEEITGLKISDVIGKTREQAFAGLIDNADKWRALGADLKHQNKYSMVWALNRADGERRILRTRGKPIFDDRGEFQGYRGVGSDITESIEIAEALEASEARFRDFDQIAADWFFELDKDLRISYISGEIHIPSGRKTSDMIGMSERDSFLGHLDCTEKWQNHLARLEAREPFELEFEWHHDDGRIVYVHNIGKPVFDANREFQGYRCCGTDITQQRKAESEARESEQRLRDFAETAADWFWEMDADLRFTYISDSYSDYGKYDIEYYLGKSREELKSEGAYESSQWQNLVEKQLAREYFSDFEYQFLNKNAEVVYARINGKPIFDENGVFNGYRGSGKDVTEAHKLSQQLSYQASHDSLTGLLNRREFENRVLKALQLSRENHADHTLCYIDLDQFKVVNDNCGHEGGDELLRQITNILSQQVRKGDTVARLGGDEFGLLLENCSLEQASVIAEKVRQAVDEFRFVSGGRTFRIGASIGLIPIDAQSDELSDIMREADAACYAAKDGGRNRVHIYHADNVEVARRHEEMQQIVEINSAFDEKRFVLYQQPIYKLQNNNNIGYTFFEMLVRMIDSDNNLVSPGLFLPVAERYNLITQLDTWVVKNAVDWVCRAQATGKSFCCSINLSGMSIASERFLSYVLSTLDHSGVEASHICFEITETAAIANIESATRFISALKEQGCVFALDDFGSGFSSFAYLKNLPVDYLKIDGFFVRDILQDSINFEMVKSINDIGHVMGKKTIAEFVEDNDTLEALKQIGVDFAQGFGIAKPEPID